MGTQVVDKDPFNSHPEDPEMMSEEIRQRAKVCMCVCDCVRVCVSARAPACEDPELMSDEKRQHAKAWCHHYPGCEHC